MEIIKEYLTACPEGDQLFSVIQWDSVENGLNA